MNVTEMTYAEFNCLRPCVFKIHELYPWNMWQLKANIRFYLSVYSLTVRREMEHGVSC